MMVYNNFDAQNLHFICLQISPQIFAILQNFPINNLRDQQFCTLLCELEWLVVVLFTGNTLEVEVLPGMVCIECMGTFVLDGLILCVFEGLSFELLCIHNEDIGAFGLHGLILCVFEDFLSLLLYIHIVGMETFDLHGWI